MKTTIEINDYEIKIEEMDGVVMISVEKDGEVIDEMEVGGEKDFEDEEEDDVQDFEEYDEDDDEEYEDDEEF
jgi:hypothetical protein